MLSECPSAMPTSSPFPQAGARVVTAAVGWSPDGCGRHVVRQRSRWTHHSLLRWTRDHLFRSTAVAVFFLRSVNSDALVACVPRISRALAYRYQGEALSDDDNPLLLGSQHRT